MMQHGPEFDSLFRFIVVVSQRAEQLINGAKLRSESRHVKPTLQAVDDVNAGLVGWRVLTQEELDAQRQAIVEQFRAEVGADRMQAESRPRLPDVLPTGPSEVREAAAQAEPGERDDELSRLQRLLGLGDRGREPAEEEAAADLSLDTEEEGGFALDLDDTEPELEADVEEEVEEEVEEDGPSRRPSFLDTDEDYEGEDEDEDVYIDEDGGMDSDDDEDE